MCSISTLYERDSVLGGRIFNKLSQAINNNSDTFGSISEPTVGPPELQRGGWVFPDNYSPPGVVGIHRYAGSTRNLIEADELVGVCIRAARSDILQDLGLEKQERLMEIVQFFVSWVIKDSIKGEILREYLFHFSLGLYERLYSVFDIPMHHSANWLSKICLLGSKVETHVAVYGL